MDRKLWWGIGIAAGVLLCVAGITIAQEKLTLELVKEKVDEAAKLLENEGDAAFDKIRAMKFGGTEGYIFVNSTEGYNLVHGAKPALEGQYQLDLKDANGVYFWVQFNEIAEKKGKGWVAYVWSKPGEKEASPKVAYIVLAKHGDKKYVVGAGMYDVTLKEVREKYPDDPVYEEE